MHSRTILASLHGRWRRALNSHRSMIELTVYPPDELNRVAQDAGLSASDLTSLACSHRGPSVLMPKRLQELGLDPGFVKIARTATYRDMERVCAACRARRRCARDLAKGDVQAGMDGYCPNAPTMDVLVSLQG